MFKTLFIQMAGFVVAGVSVFAGEATTILALGDSITARSDSYRSVLVPTLKEKGLVVEFVGPNKDAISCHAGYGGRNTKFLHDTVEKVYRKYPADIVMIHSGHNSDSKDKPVPGIIQDTEGIINTITDINPKATILLAQVVPSGKLPKYSYIPELNVELDALATRLIKSGKNIVLVNQAEGFEWKKDTLPDKVHVNTSGAKKMSDKWLSALSPLLAKKGAE